MGKTPSIDADESFSTRWGRRVRTIPLFFGATALAWALLPVCLPLALVLDVVRRSRFGLTRFVLLITAFITCETLGVLGGAAIWLFWGRSPTFLARNYRLQSWWASTLFWSGARLYGVNVRVDGTEVLTPGPILLLVRHASVADSLIPIVFVAAVADIGLRYVIKRELLWDPCLDIVGQRIPNAFVRRGSADPARELAIVRRLADGLGPHDGVTLFPEGTRFSPRRRAEALARLAQSDAALHARAQALTHVLPPRLGGTLALLDAAPEADVVVCGHVGFDGTLRLGDLWSGAMVGREVHIAFWRCPRAEIPAEREARVDWLYRQWERLDGWVAEHGAPADRKR